MTQRSNVVRLRLTDLEKKDWQEAAGGARKLSEWVRSVCNAAAEAAREPVEASQHLMSQLPPGTIVPVANLKPQVVEDAIAREVDRVHRGSRSMPDAEAGGDDSSSGDRKATAGASAPASAQCPRWMHHRKGVYCGACKRVISKDN